MITRHVAGNGLRLISFLIMATRSTIIAKTDVGYSAIYCHSDGYPEWVGRILNEHYLDPNKVMELIALGDLSSLGERVHPIGTHSFREPESGTTVAYGRDRGEKNTAAKSSSSLQTLINKFKRSDAEHAYVFDGTGWTHYALGIR